MSTKELARAPFSSKGLFTLPRRVALPAKIRPDEAEPEGCGGSTVEGENEVWTDFRSSPKRRGQFPPALRPSSLGYTRYPSLLIPRSEKNWLPSPPTRVVGTGPIGKAVETSSSCGL